VCAAARSRSPFYRVDPPQLNETMKHSTGFHQHRWLLSFVLVALIAADTCNIADTEKSISNKCELQQDEHDVATNRTYPCNIRRIAYTDLPTAFPPQGLVPSLYLQPIIITTEPLYNADFSARTTISNITQQFPNNFLVTLSSSNSYSSHRRTIPLNQYLQEVIDHRNTNNSTNRSNETWYLFGETYSNEWIQLLDHFHLPPCQMCTRALSALSFGLGGYSSGVQWHFHGPGFSEVIHGSKHWILYSPSYQKEDIVFYDDPNYTSFSWMEQIYPTLSPKDKENLYQCTLYAGEMIYFPDAWHHATINTGKYNVFVSTFTTEHVT